jgi:hypothetical protein
LSNCASAVPVQVDWNEFGKRVAGRRIALQLPQGCNVEAKVIEVRPEAAGIAIRNTSDSAACPRGRRDIPKEAFKTVRVMGRGSGARIGLAILCGLGGYTLSILATFAVKGDEFGVEPATAHSGELRPQPAL